MTHPLEAIRAHCSIDPDVNTMNIPESVYYNPDTNNFHDAISKTGMGSEFYTKWWKHAIKFPKPEDFRHSWICHEHGQGGINRDSHCTECEKERNKELAIGTLIDGRQVTRNKETGKIEVIGKAKGEPTSEVVSPGIDQIPFEALEEIGAIFAEGEPKYGRDNWKQQPDNEEWDRERARHAIRHMFLHVHGDTSENHLAKVAWWAVTTIWRFKHRTNPIEHTYPPWHAQLPEEEYRKMLGGCIVDEFSSRVCERGIQGCTVQHKLGEISNTPLESELMQKCKASQATDKDGLVRIFPDSIEDSAKLVYQHLLDYGRTYVLEYLYKIGLSRGQAARVDGKIVRHSGNLLIEEITDWIKQAKESLP
jgi:hypothetical protein